MYRRFPFPPDPAGFKQNPKGFQTRSLLEPILTDYGRTEEITVRFRRKENEVVIGEYGFDQENFQELIFYIEQGGYPRWRDGRQPGYVEAMKQSVEKAGCFPFKGSRKDGRRKANHGR